MSIFITYFVDLVFLYHWYARVSKFFDNSQLKLFHNYWSSMVHRTVYFLVLLEDTEYIPTILADYNHTFHHLLNQPA